MPTVWSALCRTCELPPTVQAILAARIDRLPARDKRLLHAASVVGKDIPHAILQPVAGLEEDELRDGLAKLREAEFLYEARLFPDLEYAFKHALTHEVAYGSLLFEQRRALHRRIVSVIKRPLSGPLDRTRRAAGAPCSPRRVVGGSSRLSSAGRQQGGNAVGATRCAGVV